MTFVSRDGGIWQEQPPPDWDQLPAVLDAARAALAGGDPLEASRRYCLARYADASAVLAGWPGSAGPPAGGEGYEEVVRFIRGVLRRGTGPDRT